MKFPFSSCSLPLQFIWWGVIGVVVSLLWSAIHIGQTVTRFENVMSESTRMEDISEELTVVLGDFGISPVGIEIFGILGLIFIGVGICLFLRRKTLRGRTNGGTPKEK